MTRKELTAEALQLPGDERWAQAIRASFGPADPPLSTAQQALLDDRIDLERRDPDGIEDWNVVRERIMTEI